MWWQATHLDFHLLIFSPPSQEAPPPTPSSRELTYRLNQKMIVNSILIVNTITNVLTTVWRIFCWRNTQPHLEFARRTIQFLVLNLPIRQAVKERDDAWQSSLLQGQGSRTTGDSDRVLSLPVTVPESRMQNYGHCIGKRWFLPSPGRRTPDILVCGKVNKEYSKFPYMQLIYGALVAPYEWYIGEGKDQSCYIKTFLRVQSKTQGIINICRGTVHP